MMQLVPTSGTTFILNTSFGVIDEAGWNARAQSISYGLPDASGNVSMIVRENVRSAGRPLTLQGGLSRADLLTLMALADSGPALTFQSSGRADIACRFFFQNGPAVSGRLIQEAIEPPQSDDWYSVTIKLIEV